ncbi:MAG TPA: VOC family protein [Acidimicrobiia bacterium]|nr:VOC family protein [Acidimicrobiia bacterium]
MEPRVTAVTLAAPDVASTVDFYRRAFGWDPAFINDEVAFFDLGGMVLSLWSGLGDELGHELPPAGAMALAHNVRAAEEVDRVIDEAVSEGATVAAPARRQDWGGYSGMIADPNGHLWEIAYNPDWPLDAEGRVRLPR